MTPLLTIVTVYDFATPVSVILAAFGALACSVGSPNQTADSESNVMCFVRLHKILVSITLIMFLTAIAMKVASHVCKY